MEAITILVEGFIGVFIYGVIIGQPLTTEDVRFILLWIGIINILIKLNNIGG